MYLVITEEKKTSKVLPAFIVEPTFKIKLNSTTPIEIKKNNKRYIIKRELYE